MIDWVRQPTNPGETFPFRIGVDQEYTTFRERAAEMEQFCEETFGIGGHVPKVGARWFSCRDKGVFAFKSEIDLCVFLVAFRG